jgi:hypothetical protein
VNGHAAIEVAPLSIGARSGSGRAARRHPTPAIPT